MPALYTITLTSRRLRNISAWDLNQISSCFLLFFLALKTSWHHVNNMNVSTGFLNELFVELVKSRTEVEVVNLFPISQLVSEMLAS